jgi:hypothetical protein
MMLRIAVDMHLACDPPVSGASIRNSSAGASAGEVASDLAELLRDVLREWAVQTRDVGTHFLFCL